MLTRWPDAYKNTPARRLDKWYTPEEGVITDYSKVSRLDLRPMNNFKRFKSLDHDAVCITWNGEKTERGCDHWKMPSWLFSCKDWVVKMDAILQQAVESKPQPPGKPKTV